jgi:hypothetical protein
MRPGMRAPRFRDMPTTAPLCAATSIAPRSGERLLHRAATAGTRPAVASAGIRVRSPAVGPNASLPYPRALAFGTCAECPLFQKYCDGHAFRRPMVRRSVGQERVRAVAEAVIDLDGEGLWNECAFGGSEEAA